MTGEENNKKLKNDIIKVVCIAAVIIVVAAVFVFDYVKTSKNEEEIYKQVSEQMDKKLEENQKKAGENAAFLIPEGVWQLVTILGVCVVFLIPCFYALKLEVSVGAYKCKECGCEIVPTYKEVMMAMHRGFTRHLKCPKCNKRTWCKKVLKK